MQFANPYLSHILCVLFSENIITKSGDAHLFKQMRWISFSFVGYCVGMPDEAYCSNAHFICMRCCGNVHCPRRQIVLVLLFMCFEFFLGKPDKESCVVSHLNYLKCCRNVQKLCWLLFSVVG